MRLSGKSGILSERQRPTADWVVTAQQHTPNISDTSWTAAVGQSKLPASPGRRYLIDGVQILLSWEVDYEPFRYSRPYWVDDRCDGLNVGIGISVSGPQF